MNTVKLYLLMLGIHFVWNISVIIPLSLLGVEYSQHVASFFNKASNSFLSDITLLPMCALAEEWLFRWLPMFIFFTILGVFIKIGRVDDEKRSKIEKYGLAAIVIISSVIFGLVHGNGFNILIQGVSGVIFSMFYLRTLYRRREAGKKHKVQFVPLLSSTVYHTLSNIPIMWVVGAIYGIVYLRKQRRARKQAEKSPVLEVAVWLKKMYSLKKGRRMVYPSGFLVY